MHRLLQLTLDFFGADVADAEDSPHAQSTAPAFQAGFRHPRANREARLGETVVAFEFKRARRRSIGFSVGPDGLTVSAPRWVPMREVDAAVQEKSKWILQKLRDAEERRQQIEANRIDWRDGAEFPFFGEPVNIVLDARGTGTLLETNAGGPPRILRVALPQHAEPPQIRDAVQAWLMKQAKQVFTQRLDHFAPQLGVTWRKLALSNAGTRWGTAHADGTIRLNWRLVHFRMDVIDYVVAHELSHLRVMDHSPKFWDTVASVVPDYAELRGQLKDEALPTW